MHLNLLAATVWALGSYQQKITFDLILRPHNAYGIQQAMLGAKELGFREVLLVELGVGSGGGLLNMAHIARRLGEELHMSSRIVGFDTGTGMPPAADYRDHPEYYQEGDYSMDRRRLKAALPPNVTLILGDLADTLQPFVHALPSQAPIGYVAIDVDYYSSCVSALRLFDGEPSRYLPVAHVYVDDIHLPGHNRWQGELLAIAEFNASRDQRKLDQARFLSTQRIFKNPSWIQHMYHLHVMDHPSRSVGSKRHSTRSLVNPYLAREPPVAGR